MLISNPSQYRKTNKNKNSSAKSSEIRSKWFKEAKGSEVQIISNQPLKIMSYGLQGVVHFLLWVTLWVSNEAALATGSKGDSLEQGFLLTLKIKGDFIIQVIVYQNQVDRALKVLKRAINKEGLFKELKRRRFYMKPSVKKKLKIKEAKKKRKVANKRLGSIWQL